MTRADRADAARAARRRAAEPRRVDAAPRERAGRARRRRSARSSPRATRPRRARRSPGRPARLVAGDVVYDDLFKARSEQVMKQRGHHRRRRARRRPSSRARTSCSQNSLTELVKRITQGGGTAVAHATACTATRSRRGRPAGRRDPRRPDQENTIIVTDELSFEVIVEELRRLPGDPGQGHADDPASPSRSRRRRRSI